MVWFVALLLLLLLMSDDDDDYIPIVVHTLQVKTIRREEVRRSSLIDVVQVEETLIPANNNFNVAGERNFTYSRLYID